MPVKKSAMPPPVRQIDQAKSSLQHLSDQERMITSRVLPPEDPVEAVFKAPEALPHSYLVNPRRRVAGGPLAAPASLRIPKALSGLSADGGMTGPATEDLEDPATAGGSPVSYQKVRRWEMLPKHAWLQAAESGQAPGPGFRDVSQQQTMRSYGPKGASYGSSLPPMGVHAMEAAAPAPSDSSVSSRIASHYSPRAAGLQPSTLYMGLPEGHAEAVDISDGSLPEPVIGEDEGASTFLPLEFFDGGEMEPMPDALWEEAEAYFLKGKPFGARSKFYTVDGKDALLPCEVRQPSLPPSRLPSRRAGSVIEPAAAPAPTPPPARWLLCCVRPPSLAEPRTAPGFTPSTIPVHRLCATIPRRPSLRSSG